MTKYAPRKGPLGPERSLLMPLLRVAWVCFDDVGGWIFQDHPSAESLPQEDVLEFIRQRTLLWGADNQYVAANIPGHRAWRKDTTILDINNVFERCGIFSPNAGHFVECDGAADKGRQMDRKVRELERERYHVGACAFDNSAIALASMAPRVLCFGNELKDKDSPLVSTWYQGMPLNLLEFTSFSQIIPAIVAAHFALLIKAMAELPNDSGKKRMAARLFSHEIKRVTRIFYGYDLKWILDGLR